MTRRPLPDLVALAAQLRLMALALVVELARWLGAGRVAAALRRRVARDLAQLERFATGIVVLTALETLAPPPARPDGGRRPPNAPRGFARVSAGGADMRAMRRKLFPRERDLRRRLARFDAVLDAICAYAARLKSHIVRIPPVSRLVAIAPLAHAVASQRGVGAAFTSDTS